MPVNTGTKNIPEVHDAVEATLRNVRDKGFEMEPEAEEELGELVLEGYRMMQDSRVLDDPVSLQRAVEDARESLRVFVESWMKYEAADSSALLTLQGFNRARTIVCPMYPFE